MDLYTESGERALRLTPVGAQPLLFLRPARFPAERRAGSSLGCEAGTEGMGEKEKFKIK